MNDLKKIADVLLARPMALAAAAVGLWLLVIMVEILRRLLTDSGLRLNKGVTKKALCAFGVRWCTQRMGLPAHRKIPKLKISYSTRPSRRMGSFRNGDTIVVHVNQADNRDFRQLANTIIHEYTHALQLTSRRQHQRYNQETVRSGYQRNPFEVEARQKADALEDELVAAWLHFNYLRKN